MGIMVELLGLGDPIAATLRLRATPRSHSPVQGVASVSRSGTIDLRDLNARAYGRRDRFAQKVYRLLVLDIDRGEEVLHARICECLVVRDGDSGMLKTNSWRSEGSGIRAAVRLRPRATSSSASVSNGVKWVLRIDS